MISEDRIKYCLKTKSNNNKLSESDRFAILMISGDIVILLNGMLAEEYMRIEDEIDSCSSIRSLYLVSDMIRKSKNLQLCNKAESMLEDLFNIAS